MNWSVLRVLLEKYYDGLSSAAEDRKLSELLERNDLPEEFFEDSILITGLQAGRKIPEPSPVLNSRIMAAVRESEKRTMAGKKRLYSLTSIAAGVLIIIGLWFVVDKSTVKQDTFNDPQLAYNQTIETLYRVSANLNKGRQHMEQLSAINNASRTDIAEQLKALEYIETSMEMLGMKQNNSLTEQNK